MKRRTTILIYEDGIERDVTAEAHLMTPRVFARVCRNARDAGHAVPVDWAYGEGAEYTKEEVALAAQWQPDNESQVAINW